MKKTLKIIGGVLGIIPSLLLLLIGKGFIILGDKMVSDDFYSIMANSIIKVFEVKKSLTNKTK